MGTIITLYNFNCLGSYVSCDPWAMHKCSTVQWMCICSQGEWRHVEHYKFRTNLSKEQLWSKNNQDKIPRNDNPIYQSAIGLVHAIYSVFSHLQKTLKKLIWYKKIYILLHVFSLTSLLQVLILLLQKSFFRILDLLFN